MNFSTIKPTAEQIKCARRMGVEAYGAGKKVTPALNAAFLAWASGTGARMASLMGAYTAGWSVAMLADGQTSDFPSVRTLAEILA